MNAFVRIIGATSIIFPYLGEFFSIKDRDSVLGRLEIFWNIGVILLPGLAWAILGHPLKNAITFNSWRLFVLICGLPSLLSVLLLCCLPETPKYLISRNRFEDAKTVFRKVYVWNTGKAVAEYPVSIIEEVNIILIKLLFLLGCFIGRGIRKQQQFKNRGRLPAMEKQNRRFF